MENIIAAGELGDQLAMYIIIGRNCDVVDRYILLNAQTFGIILEFYDLVRNFFDKYPARCRNFAQRCWIINAQVSVFVNGIGAAVAGSVDLCLRGNVVAVVVGIDEVDILFHTRTVFDDV